MTFPNDYRTNADLAQMYVIPNKDFLWFLLHRF